jgi:predicted transcriptional regulator
VSHLAETLKVRVEAEMREELERQARLEDRPPSWLHRTILREGLERRRRQLEKAGRGR